MKTKDKAKELIDRFSEGANVGNNISIQCALICVDDVLFNIDATILYHKDSKSLPINKEYWQEVKQEIEKL